MNSDKELPFSGKVISDLPIYTDGKTDHNFSDKK